jgi:hypothetical protein
MLSSQRIEPNDVRIASIIDQSFRCLVHDVFERNVFLFRVGLHKGFLLGSGRRTWGHEGAEERLDDCLEEGWPSLAVAQRLRPWM